MKFNRFHTTALCSPTRAALLTGRNHHAAGMGGITEIATSAPGYSSIRPKHSAPLAETLKLNGYSTAQFGKCHEVPVWQSSPMGPFDHSRSCPTSPSSCTSCWGRCMHLITLPRSGSTGTRDGSTRGGMPSGRRRSPARRSWEWCPPPPTCRPGPVEIQAWEDVAEDLKPILVRQTEVYAGFLEHTDHHIGRLFDALGDLGILDDTLVFCIVGDNGASAEGTPNGTFNELISLNGAAAFETTDRAP